jgi:hypothetical protein
MMNKSLRGRGHESSATAKTPTTNLKYGFQRPGAAGGGGEAGGPMARRTKKEPPFPAAFKSR